MKRKHSISKLNALLALTLVFTILVGTMAYFTDRETGSASMSTLDDSGVKIVPKPDPTVEPDDPNQPPYVDPDPNDDTDDLTNWWSWVNSKAMVNYNPGDKMTLSYILANEGSLAVDVRETFVITSDKPLSATPEFRLFTGVTQDNDTKAYTGQNVVAVETPIVGNDGKTYQYKYTVPAFSMSGSATGETVANCPASVNKSYYVVFSTAAGNAFQGAGVTIEYVVEAKQHTDASNTDDWTIAATSTMTLGGKSTVVVPKA